MAEKQQGMAQAARDILNQDDIRDIDWDAFWEADKGSNRAGSKASS